MTAFRVIHTGRSGPKLHHRPMESRPGFGRTASGCSVSVAGVREWRYEMSKRDVVVLSAVRSAIGTFGGAK